MKNSFTLILAIFFIICSNGTQAQTSETTINKINQEFKGSASGTFGFIGSMKIRLQYELLFKKNTSTGVNFNYYLNGWTGPLIEPFIRVYGKRHGNSKGLFGQLKLIYGNLKTLGEPYPDAFSNKRWSTYGFGLNCGYKIRPLDHFIIEPLLGLRVLSKPVYKCNPDNRDDCEEMQTGYEYDWFFLTGFPIDFQLKFGFQF